MSVRNFHAPHGNLCDLLRDLNGNFHALHGNLNLFVLCGEYFDLLCDLLWYLNDNLHGLHGNLYDMTCC